MLDGRPTLRTPQGSEQLAPDDLAFFATGPDGAHQVRNETDETVRVLMWSTISFPAAAGYPDSDKIGIFTGDRRAGRHGPSLRATSPTSTARRSERDRRPRRQRRRRRPAARGGRLPTGRLARTARVGGLVTGQGVRWAGMRTANRVRSPERAAAAERERTAALVQRARRPARPDARRGDEGRPDALDGRLRRPARRPAGRAAAQARRRCATTSRRFRSPSSRSSCARSSAARSATVFSDFDERAFAAASIGQVHRATTVDGDEVAVKVQYPGVAEAVETDLRNAMLLLPLVKRLAPGLDAKALADGDARANRRGARLRARGARTSAASSGWCAGTRSSASRASHTDLSTRRVLVTEYVEGERFEAVRRADEAHARPLRRDRLPLLLRPALPRPDRARRPAPGQLPPAPRRAGLLPGLRPAARHRPRHVDAEGAIAHAVRDGDAAALKAALVAGGYLPPATAPTPSTPSWALRLMRMATGGTRSPASTASRRPGRRDRDARAARRRAAGRDPRRRSTSSRCRRRRC